MPPQPDAPADAPTPARLRALFAAIAERRGLRGEHACSGAETIAAIPVQPGLRHPLLLRGEAGDGALPLTLEFGPFHDHWPWAESADFGDVALALLDGRARVRTTLFRAHLEGLNPAGAWEGMETTGFLPPLGRADRKRIFHNG